MITGKTRNKGDKIELVAHHLYSKRHYKNLAESVDNLVTLCSQVHEQFHGWNGGYARPCTPDDLMRFVQQIYPQKSAVVTMAIENAKKRLGDQPVII